MNKLPRPASQDFDPLFGSLDVKGDFRLVSKLSDAYHQAQQDVLKQHDDEVEVRYQQLGQPIVSEYAEQVKTRLDRMFAAAGLGSLSEFTARFTAVSKVTE